VAPARHLDLLAALVQRLRPLRKAGAAVAVTALAVTGGVAVALPEEPARSSAISVPAPEVRTSPVPVRVAPISRSEDRTRLEPKPPEATGHLFATTTVNVRALPDETSQRVGSLEWAEKVPVSGVTRGEWTEVVIDEESRWVATAFLAAEKPRPEPEPEPEPEPQQAGAAAQEPETSSPTGLSTAPCSSGSSVESGLTANAVAVHRAVCAAFPAITSYGGYRPDDGEHGTGRALDIMISGEAGWEVAEYVRANAGELGVSEVLYSQRIWTVERGGDGWRTMEDRGSATANHYDHVHVTVY
jgi:hypothetical protein